MTITANKVRYLQYLGQLLVYCTNNKIDIICFTFYRSPEQQMQEFIKGKSKIKEGGPHQNWLATDLAIIEKGQALFDDSIETLAKYKILGDYWKSLDPNNIWGGDFQFSKDVYHFELKKT